MYMCVHVCNINIINTEKKKSDKPFKYLELAIPQKQSIDTDIFIIETHPCSILIDRHI